MTSTPAIVETPLIELHRAAGATLAEFTGCLLPEKFSDERAEYRAARETVALFDTSWHAIFSASGRDAVRYLHAITSNDIKGLAENHGAAALLLNPQGRILADLEIYRLKEKLLVLSHAAFRERTFATMKKYILGSPVQLRDVSGEFASMALEGPQAHAAVAEATGLALSGFSEFATAEVEIDALPCTLIRRSHFGGEGAEIIAPRRHAALLWQHLRASVRAQHGLPVGMKALNALRIEAGIPWFPLDFDDSAIPHEAVLEGTHISFTKGCYTGQEIVERVRSRGHVNRKRVSLKFSNGEPPAPGSKLRAGGAEVGYVSSSAFSPSQNTAIGMGYLRREHHAIGSVVETDAGTAEVVGGGTATAGN